jgi:hypothetical protein
VSTGGAPADIELGRAAERMLDAARRAGASDAETVAVEADELEV